MYKLITNSDFDAIVCAYLLKRVYSIDEISFIEPGDAKTLIVNSPKTILANIPYIPKADVWFDHHKSNLDSHSDVDGLRALEPSCARVIAEYLSLEDSHLLQEADIIDSAKFSIDDITDPKDYRLLSFTIEGIAKTDEEINYNNFLIDNLDKPEILFSDSVVIGRMERFKSNKDLVFNYIRSRSKIIKDLLICDLRDAPDNIYLSSSYKFLHYTISTDATISIRIYHPELDRSRVRFQVGHNIFGKGSSVDVAALLKPFGGGGHFAAGGLTIESDSFDSVYKKIVDLILR